MKYVWIGKENPIETPIDELKRLIKSFKITEELEKSVTFKVTPYEGE